MSDKGKTRWSQKKEDFCRLLVSDSKMTKVDAMIQAYGLKVNTKEAREMTMKRASLLSHRPDVLARLAEMREEQFQAQAVTVDEVLSLMSVRLRLDPRTLYKDDGSIKRMNEMTKEEAMCIHKFKVRQIFRDGEQIGEIIEIELIDLKGLWDMFLKKFGSYIKNVNVINKDLSHIQSILDGIKD